MSKKKISIIFFAFILLFSFSNFASARRFSSSRGGFSRSFSRRSSGFSSSRRRKSRPGGGGIFSSRGTSKSRADSMLSKKTAQKGKMFSSRKAAVSDYKKNLKKKWSSEPKKRPKYIPNNVSSGGRNYNVVFNNGRYGFWNSAGSFMALTAANMVITNAMLSSRGYGYGGGYGGGYGYPAGGGIPFTGIICFGLIIYFAMKIKRS